jgi:hypothetical protein
VLLGIGLIDDGDDYLYIYILNSLSYITTLFCWFSKSARKDMMKHLKVTSDMPRMRKREKEDEREREKLYYTSVQFCQTFTYLSILSDMLSSDEVFLAFNHCWSYLQVHYLSLIVVCIYYTSCKQLISLRLRSFSYMHTFSSFYYIQCH